MTVSTYIKHLLSYEEFSFSLGELIEKLDKSELAIKSELSRLVKKKEVINLRKGFYLIITPRYSKAQKLPIQLYCEKLFTYLRREYYVGLFSAAKIHGASHQQVQRDYLITGTPKFNDISKSTFDIRFFTANSWSDLNIQIEKSEAGIFRVSSPALTIADLIHYQTKLGGINRMLATIEELAEELTESDLINLLSWYPNKSALQRFGFLLEQLEIKEGIQEMLHSKLNTTPFYPVLLSPKSNKKAGAVDNRWKIDVNIRIESDL